MLNLIFFSICLIIAGITGNIFIFQDAAVKRAAKKQVDVKHLH